MGYDKRELLSLFSLVATFLTKNCFYLQTILTWLLLFIYLFSSTLFTLITKNYCHTLILDLKILVQTFCFWLFQIHYVYFTTFTVPQTRILLLLSPVFLHSRPFKVFSRIASLQKGSLGPLHVFLRFISIFCMKSYKRVFWSFPAMEPIFSPCICL